MRMPPAYMQLPPRSLTWVRGVLLPSLPLGNTEATIDGASEVVVLAVSNDLGVLQLLRDMSLCVRTGRGVMVAVDSRAELLCPSLFFSSARV